MFLFFDRMQHIKILLPKIIKCSVTAFNPTSNTKSSCLFIMRRLLTGVSLNDKVQNDKSNDIKKKRKFEERPLTEEQKRKREEFFLKEEEWERQVDLTQLSDKGK